MPCEGCEQIEPNSTDYLCTCSKLNSLTCKSEIIQPLGISLTLASLNDNSLASSFDDYSIKITNDSFKTYTNLIPSHTDLVPALVQLVEQDVLASGSCDTTIKLWNLTTMQLISTLTNHTGCVNTLLSVKLEEDDGGYLISGSSDSTVNIWSNKSQIFKKITQHSDSITCLAYFQRYKYLAIGSKDSTISLWQFQNYKANIIQTLRDHTDAVFALKIIPDYSILVSASKDTTIKIWNSTSFNLITTLYGH